MTERWLHFLADPALRDPATGLWLSWRNPAHPGYPYEEATAWVVRTAALLRAEPWAAPLRAPADEGAVLLADLAAQHGGLGRGGRLYAFDTAVALDALQRWGGHDLACGQLAATLLDFLTRRQAVEGGPRLGDETADTRWSDAFGWHLLWLLPALLRCNKGAVAADLADTLLAACPPLGHHRAATVGYSHALAYGAEGLWHYGTDVARQHARAVAVELGRRQAASGGVRPWAEASADGERADATAQAIRLWHWLATDAGNAKRALTFLARQTAGDGGVAYAAGSPDRNTWCTAFALETVALPESG